MAIHRERSSSLPEIKIPHSRKDSFKKAFSISIASVLAATGIGIGADKLIKNHNNNDLDPNHGITPITTEGTMPSQETTIPETTQVETTKPVETTVTETTKPSENSKPSETTESLSQEEKDILEKLKTWPELEGAEKSIVVIDGEKRGGYIAKQENPWGAEEKEYLGGFYKNVYVEGKEEPVGAYYLQPDMVLEILTDELAKIPERENKIKISIPLDISGVKDNSDIKISLFDKVKNVIQVDFNDSNEINLINIAPNIKKFSSLYVDNSKSGVLNYPSRWFSNTFIIPKEMSSENIMEYLNLKVPADDSAKTDEYSIKVTYGQKIASNIKSPLLIYFFNTLNINYLDIQNILKMPDSDSFIFTMKIESMKIESIDNAK